MNITELLSSPQILNEANILNNADPHDGHSIQNFLKFYANGLATAPAKKMFIKKLTKFLINDPRYHYAVRELPADAPDWAKEAMANEDLYYFKPDEDLKTKAEHLSHYLVAVEQDMAQTADNDKKVFATREFQAFPKAESLDLLEKKSQEYFTRGTKVEKDTDGMKKIYTVGEFSWWKLEDAEAFRREGKVLQNCIGSIYTKARCDRDGTSILVLRDSRGISVVAVRIKNQENILEEMKGKNNHAPIPLYMPPVASLINKFKLNLSHGATRDIQNAGYYIHEGKLLTKPQAMKIMVRYEELADIGYGLKLDTPKYDRNDYSSRQFMEDIYSMIRFSAHEGDKIYEARENDTPVIVATVDQTGRLNKLKTFFNERFHDESALNLTEAVDASKKRDYYKAFINKLVDLDVIQSISSDPLRHAFWEMGLAWDAENRVLKDRGKADDHETGKGHHKWESYEGSDLAGLVGTIPTDLRRRLHDKPKVAYVTVVDTPTGRNENQHDTHMVVLVNHDDIGNVFSVHGDHMDDKHAGYKKEYKFDRWTSNVRPLSRDKKTVNSLAALAKQKHFTIPEAIRIRLGILGGAPDQYNVHEPKWEKLTAGAVEGLKMDLSHLRDHDRFKALYSVITDDQHGTGNEWTKDKLGIHQKVNDSAFAAMKEDHTRAANVGHQDGYLDEIHQGLHGNIDALYKVNVGYGADKKHGILFIVSKNVIKKIDNETETHKWQGWDDFKKVAEQLNQFAQEHHLKFAKDAVTTDKRSRKEFRVNNAGHLTTATQEKAGELSRKKKKEGADSITFSDNWTLTRMTPQEQADWERQEFGDSARGQAWLLKDDNGANKAIFMILHNRPSRMFTVHNKDLPTYPEIDKKFFPYLKTAAEEFGWKEANQGAMKAASTKIKPTILDFMRRIKNQNNELSYRHARDRYSRQDLKQAGDIGVVVGNRGGRYRSYRYQLSPTGEAVLDAADRGEVPSVMTTVEAKGKHEDWVNPKDAPKPAAKKADKKKPATTRPAATRSGGATKSTLALDKFKDHVEEHGKIPTRSEFIAYMQEEPFNMTKTGAQTYYYTTKKKYANLNESIVGSFAQLLLIEPDLPLSSFKSNIIG